MTEAVVVFAGDRIVARAIAVSARSVVVVEPKARLIVLADGWTSADELFLKNAVGPSAARVIEVSSSDLPDGVDHITPAMYLRLRIAELLKEEGWALYLDADTLVRHPITPVLTNSGFLNSGFSTAGVQDSEVPFVGCAPGLKSMRGSGANLRTPYINSGVLLMNLEVWRQNRIGQEILSWKEKHPESWSDNDALHGVLAGQLYLLPARWNATAHMMRPMSPAFGFIEEREVQLARRDPSVVHFTGAVKPWHSNASMPFLEEWRAVAADLGWTRFSHSFTVRRRVERRLLRWIDSQA